MKRVLDSGLFIASITAICFFMSLIHNNSYHVVWGLDSSVLESSANLHIYAGFIILWTDFLHYWTYIFGVFLFFLIIVSARASIKSLPSSQKNTWSEKTDIISKVWQAYKEVILEIFVSSRFESKSSVKARSTIIGVLAVLISISFISTYFLGIWSEARGLAKEDLDYLVKFRFQEGKKLNDRFRLVEVSIKQKTKQLILIDCGSKMCAGMEPEPKEEITIHYFKIEDGFSLHIPNLGELANE